MSTMNDARYKETFGFTMTQGQSGYDLVTAVLAVKEAYTAHTIGVVSFDGSAAPRPILVARVVTLAGHYGHEKLAATVTFQKLWNGTNYVWTETDCTPES